MHCFNMIQHVQRMEHCPHQLQSPPPPQASHGIINTSADSTSSTSSIAPCSSCNLLTQQLPPAACCSCEGLTPGHVVGSGRARCWGAQEAWLDLQGFSAMLREGPYSAMINCDSWQVCCSCALRTAHWIVQSWSACR